MASDGGNPYLGICLDVTMHGEQGEDLVGIGKHMGVHPGKNNRSWYRTRTFWTAQ